MLVGRISNRRGRVGEWSGIPEGFTVTRSPEPKRIVLQNPPKQALAEPPLQEWTYFLSDLK